MPDPDALAALCAAAMPHERLTPAELAHVCSNSAGDDHAIGHDVLGDRDGAAVYTLRRVGGEVRAWLLLVAVAPHRQGKGLGKDLVAAVAGSARDRGAVSLHLANAVPRYLWPGLELANTRAGMLAESAGFTPDLVAVNMAIDTGFRQDAPAGITVEREATSGALELAASQFPHWVDELTVAFDQGTAFAARDASGRTVGFGCHSCNRAGWIGPMATDRASQGAGIGGAVLAAVCADLARRGVPTGEISWVSNLRFYGKCGAVVSRVFQGGALAL